MPLLSRPRKLKHGTYFYGQSKFSESWRQYNTHATEKKTATEVVTAVEAFCGTWERARALLNTIQGCKGNAAIQTVLRGLREELAAGHDPLGTPAGSEALLDSLAPEFLEAKRLARNAPATIKSYRETLRLLREYVGNVTVQTITRGTVEGFQRFLEARGTKDGPITLGGLNIQLRNLKVFLRWVQRHERVRYLAPFVHQLQVPQKTRGRQLTSEQAGRWRKAIGEVTVNGVPLGAYFAFVGLTGSRKSEPLYLVWETDVDFEQGVLHLLNIKSRDKHKREFPMFPELRRLLESLPGPRRGRVFPLSGRSGHLSELLREAAKQAGLTGARVHDLRHTAAVHWLTECGMDLATVRQLLDHSSVDVTASNYVHFDRQQLKKLSASASNSKFSMALLPDVPDETKS